MVTADSTLQLAATHLNASIGPVLSAADVAQVLRAGSLAPISSRPPAEAMLSYLFIELDTGLLARCAAQAGAPLERVHALYQETLKHGAPRSRDWETAMDAYA